MDNVDCDGWESSLADCTHNGWNIHNCDHNEDVSIQCSAPKTTEIGRLGLLYRLRILYYPVNELESFRDARNTLGDERVVYIA